MSLRKLLMEPHRSQCLLPIILSFAPLGLLLSVPLAEKQVSEDRRWPLTSHGVSAPHSVICLTPRKGAAPQRFTVPGPNPSGLHRTGLKPVFTACSLDQLTLWPTLSTPKSFPHLMVIRLLGLGGGFGIRGLWPDGWMDWFFFFCKV